MPILGLRAGRDFRRDPLGFLRSLDNGDDVLEFRAGLTTFRLVKSPETIHRILVTDAEEFGEGKWTLRGERVMHDCLITREGELHRDRRGVLQPGFERKRLDGKAEAIVSRADGLGDRWRDGEVVEARGEMGRVALTASGEALFSLDLTDQAGLLLPALATMLAEIPRPGPPLRSGRRLAAARRKVDRVVADAVESRRASADGEDDVLSRLLAQPGNGHPPLSDEQVVDEIASLLIASVDTTPGTLAWTWLLLGRHPEVEAKVHDELDRVLDGQAPTSESVSRLEYLDRVLAEVLRLYPPVHFIDRRPTRDVELDGHPVPAGAFLLLSPLVTHRDARFYDDPDEFRPERWERERGERPRYAYFPFGGGPHTCIGMALARMELALVVATLARDWRLRPGPELDDDRNPQRGAFEMTVVRR